MKEYLAELIATFALVFIGAGSVLIEPVSKSGIIGIALAHGLVLMSMIYAIGHISGAHINPAVTIGMLVTKKINLTKALIYIIFQLIGAVIGAFLLSLIFPNSLNLGTPALDSGISFWKGIFIEIVLTFFLVFTIFGTAVDKKAPYGVYGFAIGLVLTFDILFGGTLTGASMNPARTFGPALISGFWSNHLVYWIGPILGSIIAALIYDKIFLKKEHNAN